jgi:hypothetical protein
MVSGLGPKKNGLKIQNKKVVSITYLNSSVLSLQVLKQKFGGGSNRSR